MSEVKQVEVVTRAEFVELVDICMALLNEMKEIRYGKAVELANQIRALSERSGEAT